MHTPYVIFNINVEKITSNTKKNDDGGIYYLNSHEAELSKSEYHGEKIAGYIKIFENTGEKEVT